MTSISLARGATASAGSPTARVCGTTATAGPSSATAAAPAPAAGPTGRTAGPPPRVGPSIPPVPRVRLEGARVVHTTVPERDADVTM
jgi:hypothetical protein